MATYLSKVIIVLAANGNGAAVKIDGYDGKHVQLEAAGMNATVTFQLCYDGVPTFWHDIAPALIASGGFFVDEPATHIRAVTSAYVAGTPTARIRTSW